MAADNRRGVAFDVRAAREFVAGSQAKQAQANRDMAKTVAAGVLSAALFQFIRGRR